MPNFTGMDVFVSMQAVMNEILDEVQGYPVNETTQDKIREMFTNIVRARTGVVIRPILKYNEYAQGYTLEDFLIKRI